MKKCLFLLLILIVIFSSLGMVAMAEDFFQIKLTVSVINGTPNVTYTASLKPPPDAPKLIDFYMAPINQSFPNRPLASVWTDVFQVAKYSFQQAPGTYQAIAIWAPGPTKSNIVVYSIP